MTDLRLVVFDCDGTLVDSLHMIVETMQAAYDTTGHPGPSSDAVRQAIGLSLEQVIGGLSPDFDEAECNRVASAYRDHFHALRRAGDMIEPLYPHVRETITKLDSAGIVMGIATGKGIRGLNHVLDQHDMAHFFATLQTPDNAPGKPHPGMLEQAMDATGARPEHTIMIGDTSFDMEMAGHAGVQAIGVDWGYHDVDVLRDAGASQVISRMPDLHAVLKGKS